MTFNSSLLQRTTQKDRRQVAQPFLYQALSLRNIKEISFQQLHPDKQLTFTMVLLVQQVFCGWKEHFHKFWNLPDDVNCTQCCLSTQDTGHRNQKKRKQGVENKINVSRLNCPMFSYSRKPHCIPNWKVWIYGEETVHMCVFIQE